MNELPSADALARMVTRITETMFGLSFSVSGDSAASAWPTTWRAAVLPIAGARPLTVAIASDEAGGVALGSVMFACLPESVDSDMVDDSLAELANIVAGQVKTSLGLDQALGLPRVVADDLRHPHQAQAWQGVTLRQGATQLKVWVAVTEVVL